MATYTPNIGLHQWAASDNFLRTDFNEDFKKIDTAMGGKASTSSVSSLQSQISSKTELVTGTYTGDGTANRAIYLGFRPKVLWIGVGAESFMISDGSNFNYARLTSTGFSVDYYSNAASSPNRTGSSYFYIAVR